jgi:glycosyltransferase involved in cell wall biosynthesis
MSQDNKKKFLVLTKSHWKQSQGGAELQCMYLLEAAKKNNMELKYCFISNGEKFKEDSLINYYPIKKKHIFTKLRNITFPYVFSIYRELKKSQPDLIYNRAGSSLTGICVYFGKKTNVHTVFHIANDSDLDKNFQNNKDVKKIDRFLTNYGIKNADTIIAQTHHQSALLKKYYGRNANAVIPNGHSIPIIVDKSYKKIVVVWIANWKKSKRPEVFINIVKNRVWSENVEFIMIGRTANYEKLVQEAKESGIKVMGEVGNNAVNDILQNAHLLINTSIHEGFSNTFIQAWMRSVPVISLSVDPDNLLNKKGLGVCAGTQEKLLNEIQRFVNNPILLKKTGKKARDFSIKNFSLDNFTKLLSLITNQGVPS